MTPEHQRALLERIDAHRRDGRGTDTAAASMRVPIEDYVDPARFESERRMIAAGPVMVGLSGMLPTASSYATVDVAGRSVVLTRDGTGTVHGFLNVCPHRGAEVAAGCGEAAVLACPYHGWTFWLDGTPASRRRKEYFDDVVPRGLTEVPVLEADGLLWVCADAGREVPSAPLAGAEIEVGPLGLERYRLFGTRTFTRPMNWKLAVDTFCEAYHLAILHRTTLDPLIHSDFALFDAFGPHGRLVATRRSIEELDTMPVGERELLPHATVLWFLVPNTVLIHQQDHVQVYRSTPGRHAGEADLTVSVYVPPDTTRSDEHWRRNFDLLVDVTDAEDFATAAGIQRGFATAAHAEVVFGRNEPALQHFHRSIDASLAAGPGWRWP